MFAPPQMRWTVYLHGARKCYHFFKSIYPFEQLYLAAFSDKFTPSAKSSAQETISSPPLVLLPSICIAGHTSHNVPTWILCSDAQLRWAGQVELASFHK